jgi:hypothetical protein
MTAKMFDMSNWTDIPSRNQLQCLYDKGYRVACVGSSFDVDKSRKQNQAIVDFGKFTLWQYAWLFHPIKPYTLSNVVKASQGFPVKMIAIDVEDPSLALNSRESNARDIRTAIDFFRSVGYNNLCIYTGYYIWNSNCPADTFGLPLWYANYRDDPDSWDPHTLLPGAWKPEDLIAWQWSSNGDCGLNIDLNIYYGEKEEDMKSFLAWCPELKRVYFVGPAGPVWITDAKVVSELEGQFGKLSVVLSWSALQALGAK